MKIGLVSLGCSKNLVDSELMLGALREAGFVATDELAQAEVLIVNSCGFIESAKKESIDAVLRLAEYKQTGVCRVLVLAGCLGQRYSGDLMNELPEIDAIVGTGAWDRLRQFKPLCRECARSLPKAIRYCLTPRCQGCDPHRLIWPMSRLPKAAITAVLSAPSRKYADRWSAARSNRSARKCPAWSLRESGKSIWSPRIPPVTGLIYMDGRVWPIY